jgi:hypothetical protein
MARPLFPPARVTPLRFSQWKGARFGLFSFGNGGAVDFDYLHYEHGKK